MGRSDVMSSKDPFTLPNGNLNGTGRQSGKRRAEPLTPSLEIFDGIKCAVCRSIKVFRVGCRFSSYQKQQRGLVKEKFATDVLVLYIYYSGACTECTVLTTQVLDED